MVYSFVIASLQSSSVKLLYSTTFNHDECIYDPQDRRNVLFRICLKVGSEYEAVKRYINRNDANDLDKLKNDNVLPEFSRGVVRLQPGEYFQDGKILLWFAAVDFGFALILENRENVAVATLNMKLLIQNLQQYTRILTDTASCIMKPEKITIVVQKSIPDGVLPLHSSALLKERLKDLDKTFSKMIKEKT